MDSFQEEVDQVDEAANVFAGRAQELEQEIKNIDLHWKVIPFAANAREGS